MRRMAMTCILAGLTGSAAIAGPRDDWNRALYSTPGAMEGIRRLTSLGCPIVMGFLRYGDKEVGETLGAAARADWSLVTDKSMNEDVAVAILSACDSNPSFSLHDAVISAAKTME